LNSRVTITAWGKADIILAKQTLPLASEILVLVILPLSWHADEITVLVIVRYGGILFEGRVCLPNVLYHISSRDGCLSTSISPGCTYSKELYSVSFYQPLRYIQAILASIIIAPKSAYLWELFLPTGYGRGYLRFILCFQESFNVLRGDNVFEDY